MRKLAFAALIGAISACGNDTSSKLNVIGGTVAPNDIQAKGVYPATIGIWSKNVNGCTGVRISKNVFLSAAHCLEHAPENDRTLIFASNSRLFEPFIKNIRIHPTWHHGSTTVTISGSDVATFELAFASREERVIFDGFVDIAQMDYKVPSKNQSVFVAGFGCARLENFPSSACLEDPKFKYLKYASNYVYEGPILGDNVTRYFELDASSDKANANGFIANGDSGGPVYSQEGALIGINHAGSYMLHSNDDAFLGTTRHSWLGYADVKSWIDSAISSPTEVNYFSSVPDVISVTYVNGDKYIGQFNTGFRNGRGRMNFSDGRSYYGDWVNDIRQGYGEQTWPSGAMYVSYKGEWSNDVVHGKGTMVYASGMIYSGQHANGKINGQGTMTYANGDVRTGNFVNSKREGEFILVTKAGNRYREQFVNDVRVSHQKIN